MFPTAQRSDELRFQLNNENLTADTVAFVSREVRFLHDVLGMSFAEIAEQCGVAASTISRLHRGETKLPSFSTITRILKNLDLESDDDVTVLRRRRRA